ncbi:MAG: SHD1 domain-containing protein [Pirellulaceae bacterium]
MNSFLRTGTAMFALSVLFAVSVKAQTMSWNRQFEIGDDCFVYHFNQWKPAVIADVDGKKFLVEMEFAGSTQQGVFTGKELRFPWEEYALCGKKTWEDSSGQFTIDAVPVGVDIVANTIKLHNVETDDEIDVPIDRLCDKDQKLVSKLIDQAAKAAPAVLPMEEFTDSTGYRFSDWSAPVENLYSISPDPAPYVVSLPMAGVGIPRTDFFEKINRIIPIGGDDGWVAIGTKGEFGRSPSRLIWASLKKRKIMREHAMPSTEVLLAVEPRSQLVLTFSDSRDKALTLWKSEPDQKIPQAMIRWRSESGSTRIDDWFGEIISDTVVLHRWGTASYVAWDIEKKETVYKFDQESFFNADPKLSPGKKWIALPEDDRVRILSAATGDTVAVLNTNGRGSGIGFNDAGDKMYVVTDREVSIWELGSTTPPIRIPAFQVGSPFGSSVECLNDRYLFIDGDVLFDLQLEMPVWRYWNMAEMESTEIMNQRRDGAISVADGKLCYSAFHFWADSLVVGAVNFPGNGVYEAIDSVDLEKLFVLQTGDRVNVQIQCGQYDSIVNAAIANAMEKVNWTYDPNSKFTIHAKMYRGATQSAVYHTTGGGSQTVSTTPYVSSIEIKDDNDRVIWSSQTASGGLPPVVFVRGNETIQSRVGRFQQENPEFFNSIVFPDRIKDPQYSRGFGTSEISLQGIRVISAPDSSVMKQNTPK